MSRNEWDVYKPKHTFLDAEIAFYRRMAWRIVFVGFASAGWGIYKLYNDLAALGSYLQGASGSLFALAGLIFIYVAFLGQKQQVIIQNEQSRAQWEKQREEEDRQEQFYKQQSKAIEAQQKQFAAQQENLKRQAFESHFFKLLALHNSIVGDLRMLAGKDEFTGRNVFFFLGKKLNEVFRATLFTQPNGTTEDTEDGAIEIYELVFGAHPNVLGHYFRNFYHIIKFVDESDVVDKKRYTSIARAQLSSSEHILLFYNGLSGYGKVRFKRLIEEYALLENMGPDILVNPKHRTAYSPKSIWRRCGVVSL